MAEYIVVLPYWDLGWGEARFWMGKITAQTFREAWDKAEAFCADEELLLRTLVEVDVAEFGLEGPDFLDAYGLAVGEPYVCEADRFLTGVCELPTRDEHRTLRSD